MNIIDKLISILLIPKNKTNDINPLKIIESKIKDALVKYGYHYESDIDYLGAFTTSDCTLVHYYKQFDNKYTIRFGFNFPRFYASQLMTIHIIYNNSIEWFELKDDLFALDIKNSITQIENRAKLGYENLIKLNKT